MTPPGLFLTFEGVEGVGKTTQLHRLEAWLLEKKIPVTLTREPGGTPFGQTIRSLILDPTTKFASQHTEILLFIADRLEHVSGVIEPALSRGNVVVCDRFIDSTVAYQVGGRGVDRSLVDTLNHLVGILPHHTILLDLDPEEGLRRARGRAGLDRFEQEAIAFHHRVREMYLTVAKENNNRFTVISVDQLNVDEVFDKILSVVGPMIEG